jgi:methionyl aminopeptidase
VISIKTDEEFESMRAAGRIVAEVHAYMRENVRPGVTTGELDAAAERIIRDHGATPEFKGYHGFPASICASVNEEVVHGIPGSRRLEQGDVIGIDVGARIEGFVGDAALSLAVGEVDPEAQRLLDTTQECLNLAVAVCGPGVRLSAIGAAVQQHAESRGYTLVREYAGHGIGRRMHEEPSVPNYVDPSMRHRDVVLRPGMAICIEPMVNAGGREVRCSTMAGRSSRPTVVFPPISSTRSRSSPPVRR